jgi:magnesium transporter
MAVTDAAERLVGVIMVDDIVDVIEEEADEDLKALGGVKSDEELSDTVLDTARSRFPWLLANTVTALCAATVIRAFEGSVEKMVALAVLMPIVASMGGNAGTQTMTVTVRALATRETQPRQRLAHHRREMMVGVSNGVAFGLILGVVAAPGSACATSAS